MTITHINDLTDNEVDAWLAYELDYSNISLVNNRLYACSPMRGAWEPVGFHTEQAGTELIDKYHPTMEPQWVRGGVSHWWAYIGYAHDTRIHAEGQTHRQAALRCILHSMRGASAVPGNIPPPRKKT